jgi:hypothetical protein
MSDTASNQNSSSTSVSASRVIAADAQRLFDIVADPTLHHVIDGSGSVKGTRGGSRKLALGDKFTTSMRIGVPYLISNKVVEYVEGERIAWAHLGGWRWRYEFESVEGGTKVTETFDWGPSKAGAYINFMKWPAKNQRSIEATLSRLEAFATNASSSI